MGRIGLFARLALKVGSLHGLAHPQLRITISWWCSRCRVWLRVLRTDGLRSYWSFTLYGGCASLSYDLKIVALKTSDR
jgi:hypothetical protein